MKKILLMLISIVFFSSAASLSQNVFPESDAIWNIQINEKEYYYGLSGDTIVNDTIYNKLYLLNDTTLNIGTEDEYIGGFRQEGKKVWFHPHLPVDWNSEYLQYPHETLLYDFSKKEGDTIWHNIVPNLNIYYWSVADSISASIISFIDEETKTYHTQQYTVAQDGVFSGTGRNDIWEEGIGSTQGLFWFLSQKSLSGFPEFHLACFKQGTDVKYIDNPTCNSCFSYTTEISEINVAPIEVIEENKIICIKGELSVFPCLFKLFTPLGQLLFEKEVQSNNEVISVKQIKGILLYQIQKNHKIIKSGKLSLI
jgi:hypothetical protein